MPIKILRSFFEALHGGSAIARHGLKTFVKDPQIIAYPLMAVGVIWLTSPLVTKFVVSLWRHVDHPEILNQASHGTPHVLLAHLGLVTFSVFYTIFITSYFTCALSASVLAKLEGRAVPPLYGLWVVLRQLPRVSWFALMAVFFFPFGIFAQRRKLPRGVLGVIGSSFSLSTAQLAPAIVSEDRGVFATVVHAVDTLGKAWRESLVIRVGLIITIVLLGSLSFLPKLIQHYWFVGGSAHIAGWAATILLGVTSYVIVRVIGTVFTTTLYYQASHRKN